MECIVIQRAQLPIGTRHPLEQEHRTKRTARACFDDTNRVLQAMGASQSEMMHQAAGNGEIGTERAETITQSGTIEQIGLQHRHRRPTKNLGKNRGTPGIAVQRHCMSRHHVLEDLGKQRAAMGAEIEDPPGPQHLRHTRHLGTPRAERLGCIAVARAVRCPTLHPPTAQGWTQCVNGAKEPSDQPPKGVAKALELRSSSITQPIGLRSRSAEKEQDQHPEWTKPSTQAKHTPCVDSGDPIGARAQPMCGRNAGATTENERKQDRFRELAQPIPGLVDGLAAHGTAPINQDWATGSPREVLRIPVRKRPSRPKKAIQQNKQRTAMGL